MRPLRILCFPLICSLLLFSCSSSREISHPSRSVSADQTFSTIENGKFSPLPSLESPLLFKASISIFKNYYSGLILIKQMPSNGAIHVVFLSELGLNLMDLVYKDDEFKVISVQEFLNKPSILNTLQNDFRTLLLDLSDIDNYSVKKMDDEVSELLQFKHKSKKYLYCYHETNGPTHIRRKKGWFGKVDFEIQKNPLRIGIEHSGIRLKIDLTQLKH